MASSAACAQEDKESEGAWLRATIENWKEEIANGAFRADLSIASMSSICTCRRCATVSPICRIGCFFPGML